MSIPNDSTLEKLLDPSASQSGSPDSPISILEKKVDGLTNIYYNHIIRIHDLNEQNHQLKVYISNMMHHSETKFAELKKDKEDVEKKLAEATKKLEIVSEESIKKDEEIKLLEEKVKELEIEKTDAPSPVFKNSPMLQQLLEATPKLPLKVPVDQNFKISYYPLSLDGNSSPEESMTSSSSSFLLAENDEMPILSSEKLEAVGVKEFPIATTFEEAVKINERFDFGDLAEKNLSSFLFNPKGDRRLPQIVSNCRNRYCFFQNQARTFYNTHHVWNNLSYKEKEDWKKKKEKMEAIQEIQEKCNMIRVMDNLGRRRDRISNMVVGSPVETENETVPKLM